MSTLLVPVPDRWQDQDCDCSPERLKPRAQAVTDMLMTGPTRRWIARLMVVMFVTGFVGGKPILTPVPTQTATPAPTVTTAPTLAPTAWPGSTYNVKSYGARGDG